MHKRIWLKALVALALCFGGAVCASADSRTGRASVIDGDTIEIHGARIRLFGIDAPESRQTCKDAAGKAWRCGKEAAWRLDRVVSGKTVECRIVDQDRYGRDIGVCDVGGQDIGEAMVSWGLAVAYRKYSNAYLGAEENARAETRGLWAGRFEYPWEWRKRMN